ncbi:SH3 domain-containing protein 19-like [Myxocyprinus asiaticus]|uniref:SH3 domain-containing protein 19-like n=1 Tax=Myxocyprinus asiaticus TaxID=70543 RepID=UPI002223894E|nr:SH3 domain-containing protein 19-like [Myxocyprinus asiaticus]
MAEAREQDEERLRETGGGVRRRSAEHSDRNKPEHRQSSQGPLSSIRAVIKRTSTRTSSQSDHHRDRRHPEITILSAEPLQSNAWFPGASGAFPPAPPPAPPSWTAASATVQLPPPSYEQVIKEKSREQSTHSCSSSSSPPASRHSTSTIATQTDTDSPGPQASARPVRRPPKPPRPSLPLKPLDPLIESDLSDFPASIELSTQDTSIKPHPESSVQTDFDDIIADTSSLDPAPTATASTQISFDSPPELMKEETNARPRPRPRSKVASRLIACEDVLDQPVTREVKVQTLVHLKDDGANSMIAEFSDVSSNFSSKYFQDLLEVFGSDETHVLDAKQSQASDEDEEKDTSACDSVISKVMPEPVEPLNRPQPRPRTQKPKPLIAPKPCTLETEVFVSGEPNVEQDPFRHTSNPPVPPPRPLLNKHQSPSDVSRVSPSTKPSAVHPESTPLKNQMPTAAFSPSERRYSDDQATNSSSNTPLKASPVTSTDRSVGKRPSGPKHSRPPPPVLRKASSSSQVADTTVNVSIATDAPVPPLPPRPSGGRLLPLRPPPIKVTKPAGPASSSPTASNQLPGSRVPKRGPPPPLPPRPKPGHPLYRYSSKVVQGNVEEESAGKEQEEPSLREEEQLIVLDDTNTTHTQLSTLHELWPSGEVKGQAVTVSGGLDASSEQQTQPNTHNRGVARFAFKGEEGELTFSEGDVITVTEYVNEEWGRGSLNGRIGIFPLNFIQVKEEAEALPRKPALESPVPPAGQMNRGRALYDFSPEYEDELCLKAGDVVCELEDMDDEWFLGEFGGKRGIVPKNYIQKMPDP